MKLLNIKTWRLDKDINFLFKILNKKNEETRFIGGCVRDLILKKKGEYDIDLATTLTPNETLKILKQKKIKIITSGFSHGTIIAVLNKKKFEITSLRKDIITDGRHAKVEFTKDWLIDSKRRDFTINAISCNFDGDLYDYHGGLQDLKEGKIKFIGDPSKRIKEDFLRMLRYFRFYGYYGKKKITKLEIKVFQQFASNLKKLSSERIYLEFKKIILCENFYKILKFMEEAKILKYIILGKNNLKRIKNLEKLSKAHQLIDFSSRLAILLNEKKLYRTFKNLKLSKNEQKKIINIIDNHKRITFKEIKKNKMKFIYIYGNDMCISLIVYNFVKFPKNLRVKDCLKLIFLIKKLKAPKFFIFGKDIINFGIKPGPKIGKILKFIEKWWIDNNFKPSRNECLKKIKDFS